MKIGVVLPTYRSENWRGMILRFTNSLTSIQEVDNLEFLVNLQNIDPHSADMYYFEYLEDQIYQLNTTWGLLYRISDPYPKPISMVRIRNDCMMLDPDCDIYLFVDDDMKFNPGAGHCYNEIIRFFEEDDQLGLVMSAGYLGGYNYVGTLKYATEKHWTVCRGLFLRNIHTCAESPIYPALALQIHNGGYEEMIAAMEIVRSKHTMATHFNNPTTHKITPMDTGKASSKGARYEDDQIHNIDITFETSSRYLLEEYGIDFQISQAKDYQLVLRLISHQITK